MNIGGPEYQLYVAVQRREFEERMRRVEFEREMRNLSRCLRDAGALCAAFVHGARRCSCDGSWDVQAVSAIGCHLYPGAWFPGCGTPAPEST